VALGSLGALRHSRLPIQIDRTPLNEHLNGLRMRVYYRKRAMPVLWQVLTHPGNSPFKERTPVGAHWEALLPAGCSVLILADRAFGQLAMRRSIRLHNWAFCLPVKGTHFICPTPGGWLKLKHLAPAPGTHSFLTEGLLTQAPS